MKLVLLALFLVAVILASIVLGRYSISLDAWRHFLLHPGNSDVAAQVLLRVRLPRILGGLLIGAGLSVSGGAYQGLFRNPLISPDILGASAGAGIGAAIAILLGCGAPAIQAISFLGGLAAVGATCFVAGRVRLGNDPVLAMVLSGVMMASICEALISLTKTVADPEDKLPAITFWLMGSLSSINATSLVWLLILIPLGIVVLMVMRWKLNVLSMGEEEAASLGVDTRKARWLIVLSATMLTTAAVSVSGMIGWVGLVIPHLARMIVGPNYKVLLPASILLGGSYMLLVDDLSRSAMASEIPLGILTHLIGAPFFLYLLIRTRQGWA
ncbi:FecCD family ABC transporter permease [Paracidobacterium acidisoli]|uniref:Iron ABC transporter permease n=1 Tax=Paracidobacterium acidisoli TaxID=2303751 RepID=A0A372IQV7_9BACT|nr:iron ABC transporter permease [Paracidobacterium acidisoli]MBT9331517.1 iron ABC transporter permease [Paracidobacterium acidisoli]